MKWEINWPAMGLVPRGTVEEHYVAKIDEIGRAHIKRRANGIYYASVNFRTEIAAGTFESFDEAATSIRVRVTAVLQRALEECQNPKGGDDDKPERRSTAA